MAGIKKVRAPRGRNAVGKIRASDLCVYLLDGRVYPRFMPCGSTTELAKRIRQIYRERATFFGAVIGSDTERTALAAYRNGFLRLTPEQRHLFFTLIKKMECPDSGRSALSEGSDSGTDEARLRQNRARAQGGAMLGVVGDTDAQ